MVRIRVKINVHDGQPKKPGLIKCICAADAYINKIVESKEAFFLITDDNSMDVLLSEDSRRKFVSEGFEIQFPPEYEAARTVMIRNVDSVISQMTENEIVQKIEIDSNLKVKKLIKIPNSSHLLKIMFQTTAMADRVVEKGVKVGFQYFHKTNIEKEMFVSIIPCYRCYSYKHMKKNCPKPTDYMVCSNCAQPGHIYTDCQIRAYKCINCGLDHRTLAAKCEVRKKIIREKVKERRDRSRTRVPGRDDLMSVTTETLKVKLPENYLAVMAATITLAEKRETEYPGSYQYVVDEMLAANGIPPVRFPDTVVKNFQSQFRDKESRKRQRSQMDDTPMPEEASSQASQESEVPAYVLTSGGIWRLATEVATHAPTPIHTPKSTPVQTPAPTPIQTPAPTPIQTPAPTPTTSPVRETGAKSKEKVKVPRAKAPSNPGLLIIIRTDIVYPDNMNNQMLKKDIGKEKTIKYIYTNPAFNSEEIRRDIKAGKIDLTRIRRIPLVYEYFQQIKSGGLYKTENIEKYVRR